MDGQKSNLRCRYSTSLFVNVRVLAPRILKNISFYHFKSYFIYFTIPFYNSLNIPILIFHITPKYYSIFYSFHFLFISRPHHLSLFTSLFFPHHFFLSLHPQSKPMHHLHNQIQPTTQSKLILKKKKPTAIKSHKPTAIKSQKNTTTTTITGIYHYHHHHHQKPQTIKSTTNLLPPTAISTANPMQSPPLTHRKPTRSLPINETNTHHCKTHHHQTPTNTAYTHHYNHNEIDLHPVCELRTTQRPFETRPKRKMESFGVGKNNHCSR